MIVQLPPSNNLIRISYLHHTKGPASAIRYMDRVLENMAHAGNASVVPFRTKNRRTVMEWPTPPQSA